MDYEYCQNDINMFATNLLRDSRTGFLRWDSAKGRDVLIIQMPYGQRPLKLMNDLCQQMKNINFEQGKYCEIQHGIYGRFVSPGEKASRGGCPINGEASTYTIFCCDKDDVTGVCKIFEPTSQGMSSPFCDIPIKLSYRVKKMEHEGGFIRKRVVSNGFYKISFPDSSYDGYKDGDLFYQIGDLKVPITNTMLKRREFFVKSERIPEIYSSNTGLHLEKI